MTRSTKSLASVLLGWGISLASVSGQPASETLLAFGAGTIGTWATEYSLSNKTAAAISVYLGNTPEVPTVCPPVTGCSPFAISIPLVANGSARSSGPAVGFGMMHLKATNNLTAPVVKARIVNTAAPSQWADLPVFRLSTLLALNPAELVFPGATRSGSSHSNLLLAVLRAENDFTPRSISVVVEVLSSSGQVLGSRDLNLDGGSPIFLVDALSSFGVTSLDQGQVRVIKTGGNGVLWGIMPSINADGTVTVSLGVNL